MNNAVFYGFQFPHHGQFSAFSALSREFEQQGVKVFRMPFPNIPGWMPGRVYGELYSRWFRLNEYRLKAEFNAGKLVHYFFPENSLYKAPLWKKGGQLVLSCHQPAERLEGMAKSKTGKYFFEGLKAADSVVLMASCELDAYRALAPSADVICIPHGVDTDFFCPDSSVKTATKNRFRILTVGNWLRDYSLWAETVCGVSARLRDVEFVVIANSETLAEVRKNLIGTVANVSLLHGISDEALRCEYQKADLLFLPLTNSWANNALLEGMASGRPLVVTDLPATREYAGDDACFIEKGSSNAAIEMILQLCGDQNRRDELGRKARERMESQFTWRIIAKQYMDLYQRLPSNVAG